MTEIELGLALTGDEDLLVRAAVSAGLLPDEAPSEIKTDDVDSEPGDDWLNRAISSDARRVLAKWNRQEARLTWFKGRVVSLNVSGFALEPVSFARLLSRLPFTVASTMTLYPEWTDGSLGEEYYATSFGGLHLPHGWACAFKGAGHERLVTRRWLARGPWAVIDADNDTSLVLFHDPSADAATALAQAAPGHCRMGISETGGFLSSDYVYTHELDGFYNAESRTLKIVAHGREVSQHEMLDARAARHYQALGDEQPLDDVAYVFMEETEARAHLHELWLRGLQCWAIVDGDEVRLDDGYVPEPDPPDWVERLRAG